MKRQYVVMSLILVLFLSWGVTAQIGNKGVRNPGDSRGLADRVTALEEENVKLKERLALHDAGQIALYEINRMVKTCRKIVAGNQIVGWGAFVFDETDLVTGDKWVVRDDYVGLLNLDLAEIEAHMAELTAPL